MNEQDLSIFEDETAVPEEAVAEEPSTEEAPAEAVEQEPQPEASDTGEQAAPPVAEPKQDPGFVPITAMLDEREKRQKAEAEAEQLRRFRQEHEQQQRAPKPDYFDNPEEAVRHQVMAQTLRMSRFHAEQQHGKEAVDAAQAFFDQNPQLSHQLMDHPSPFHAAVDFHKKQMFMSEIGDNPEAWKAQWEEQTRARIRQELQAELATSAPPPQPAPPPSLSKAGAGGKTNEITVEAPKRLNGLFNG